jgi:hypothetical protein
MIRRLSRKRPYFAEDAGLGHRAICPGPDIEQIVLPLTRALHPDYVSEDVAISYCCPDIWPDHEIAGVHLERTPTTTRPTPATSAKVLRIGEIGKVCFC